MIELDFLLVLKKKNINLSFTALVGDYQTKKKKKKKEKYIKYDLDFIILNSQAVAVISSGLGSYEKKKYNTFMIIYKTFGKQFYLRLTATLFMKKKYRRVLKMSPPLKECLCLYLY